MHPENRDRNPFQLLFTSVKGWVKLLMLLFGFLCFLAGGWGFYCLSENERGRKEWERVKAGLEAQGEIMDLESFVTNPIPDEQNFAKAPIIDSISFRNTPSTNRADWLVYKDRYIHSHIGGLWSQARSDFAAMVKDLEADPDEPIEWSSSNPTERVLEWAGFDPEIERKLTAAAKRDGTFFPIEQIVPFDYSRLHYSNFRVLVQRIAVIASADLAMGRPGKAKDLLQVNMTLSRGLHGNQRYLVGAMMGVAIQSTTAAIIWEGLVDPVWEEQQLVELERQLRGEDLIASVQDAMRRERAASAMYYTDTPTVYKFYNYSQMIGSGSAKINSKLLGCAFLPDGWAYRARATYAKLIQDTAIAFYDRETCVATPSIVSSAIVDLKREHSSNHLRDRFVLRTIPDFRKAYVAATHQQVQIDLARIAIGIERCRLQKNRLPYSLDELAPEILDHLPRDRVGGKPYRYRTLTGSEYMLWGVGWDEIDGEGVVAEKKEQGDWVWFSFAKV